MHRHTRLGAIADTATRGVEDAAQTHRVVGVVEHLQVRDDVAHLLALVEPHTADDLVGHTVPDEDVLERAGGIVGAVEHRDVGVGGVAAVDEPVDLGSDEARLVVLVVGDVTGDEFALARIRPQPLLAATRVLGDDGIGRRQDVLGGAVVLFEQDRAGLRIVALELLDVADRGAAEGVDRLVGVAHHAQFARGDGGFLLRIAHEGAHQHVLRVVGVLVLVDQHVTEPASVVLGDLRVRLQQRHRLADEIVEVEGVRRAQALLVVRVDPGDDAGEFGGRRIGLRLVGGLLRPDQFVLEVRDLRGQQPGGVLLAVEFEILRDHREQTTGIVGVVDCEIRIHALEQTRLRAQDPDAARVEGRDPHRIRARPHQGRHPLAHLAAALLVKVMAST